MTITRAQTEAEIVGRLSGILTALSLSTVVDGTNALLNYPIRRSLRKLGYTVADPTDVADSDIDDVTTANEEKYFDLVEYFALQQILTNMGGVDYQAGPRSERLSQLGSRIEALIEAKRDQIEDEHGIALGKLRQATYSVKSIV